MIPTLWVIASVAFALSHFTEVDMIAQKMEKSGILLEKVGFDYFQKEYQILAKKYQKDLPYFYFAIKPDNYPNTLNQISTPSNKVMARTWLNKGYTWQSIQIKLSNHIIEGQSSTDDLQKTDFPPLPKFYWHGLDNQYHLWLKQLLVFDFGRSIKDDRAVMTIISEALPWTMMMSIIAIVIGGMIAIPIGSRLASTENVQLVKIVTTALYMVYSVPVFWLATLLVIFCTTDEYGSWLHWFPSVGVKSGYYESFLSRLWYSLSHLILPIFCLCIHSMAYDIMQVKTSMKNQYSQDYVYTALAKGLSKDRIRIYHVLRNALIPIITLVVSSLPVVIAGSVVIETIFNIPGMGRLLMNAIYSGDWPVVYGIMICTSFITLCSYLLGDMLYMWSDPKIQLDK